MFILTKIIGNDRNTNESNYLYMNLLNKSVGIALSIIFLGFQNLQAQENRNFKLADNEVTVICSEAEIGESGEINGVVYTRRTSDKISPENAATTCTSGITNMSKLFSKQEEFNENISSWDVSKVDSMNGMFSGAQSFNQDLEFWDVSSVKDMSYMFDGATSFSGNISTWNVSNVTTMKGMFRYAVAFKRDLKAWDVSLVTDMSEMFSGASAFDGSILVFVVFALPLGMLGIACRLPFE